MSQPNDAMVTKALKDAMQALQDALNGKQKSAPPHPPDIGAEDLAAAFFAKQQPAGLDVKEWAAILSQQRQQRNKTSVTADDKCVKEKSQQQQVDSLYQAFFQ
jgi:hypothetical protein